MLGACRAPVMEMKETDEIQEEAHDSCRAEESIP